MAYRGGPPQKRSRRSRYGGGVTRDDTDADFIATVSAVGEEPHYVSGFVPAYQSLNVNVSEVIRGQLQPGAIDLDVLVAMGYPHIGWGMNGLPALDSNMVQPGVSIHVWANYENNRWRAVEISTDGPAYS